MNCWPLPLIPTALSRKLAGYLRLSWNGATLKGPSPWVGNVLVLHGLKRDGAFGESPYSERIGFFLPRQLSLP